MLNYNDLYETFRKEKYSENLQPIEKNFLTEFSQYLKELRKESTGESDLFGESIFQSKKQLENAIAIFKGLMLRRKKKLLNLVFIAAETGIMKKDYENMFEFEKKIFDSLIKSFEEGDKDLSAILNNKKENHEEEKNKMIIFNEDTEQFVDMNGKLIGPYNKGELVNLDSKVCKILVENKKLLLIASNSLAQETIVQGKVTDANSGDPLPFVNVYFKGTQIGITTDFDGNYQIKTNTPTDSLVAAYVGYKTKLKVVNKGTTQTINFQLVEDVTSLESVVVKAGENPAFEILRRVQRHKDDNDKRKLSGYEYDTYTKIEIDVDNISDKFRQKKIVQKITSVLDSVERIAGEDGKPILPLLITESVSKVYYRDNPSLKREMILKSRITGVGVTDGTTVTQMIGSSFQEYNFYQNWLNIVTKEFVSPIADVWRLYYDYDLSDSLMVDGYYL